jgi:hypothetical protein
MNNRIIAAEVLPRGYPGAHFEGQLLGGSFLALGLCAGFGVLRWVK